MRYGDEDRESQNVEDRRSSGGFGGDGGMRIPIQLGGPGGMSLNFAKFNDKTVDDALDEARTTDDVDARKRAYAKVQSDFGDQVPYVWLGHTTWTVAANTRVRGLTNGPLPDGKPSMAYGGQLSGYGRLTETWLATS